VYASPLERPAPFRVVDQDLAHQASGQGEEMSAVAELDSFEADEFHERLVYEAGGLKRSARSLAPQLSVRDLVEFLVYEGGERMERAFVASPMGPQEIGDVVPIPRQRSPQVVHTGQTPSLGS
jgi:hypothetical protein